MKPIVDKIEIHIDFILLGGFKPHRQLQVINLLILHQVKCVGRHLKPQPLFLMTKQFIFLVVAH